MKYSSRKRSFHWNDPNYLISSFLSEQFTFRSSGQISLYIWINIRNSKLFTFYGDDKCKAICQQVLFIPLIQYIKSQLIQYNRMYSVFISIMGKNYLITIKKTSLNLENNFTFHLTKTEQKDFTPCGWEPDICSWMQGIKDDVQL